MSAVGERPDVRPTDAEWAEAERINHAMDEAKARLATVSTYHCTICGDYWGDDPECSCSCMSVTRG